MLSRTITFILIFFFANPIHGHGDLHERIKKVTKEIKNHPDSSYLYLKRGELLFQHEDYKKSIGDFKTCSKLGLRSNRLEFGLAKSFEKTGKLEKSLSHLNRILAEDPGHVKALRHKGRVLMRMKRYPAAGICFEKVIQYADKTFTENYIEASLAWENANEKEGSRRAVNIVKQGMLELGELTVFLDRLVELYLKYEDHETALVCQTKIIVKSNRKERPYYQRALIHLGKGDKNAARLDLENSIQAIEKLPLRIKSTKAVMDLESTVHKLLKTL